ncbi:MAG TPA: TatD family hydrolase [Polyangiaceae bacterium]|jgi:TatD DNase family protein|nr:TatD family hydrolase [Polyangiaceae bacterium]
MLVDSHCHLDVAYFPEGPDEVLSRARAAGVSHFVVIGVGGDASAAEHAVGLSRRFDDVSATVGMHPHDARMLDESLSTRLEELAREAVAVGEVGLDHHYMHSAPEVQERVFREMIQLARRLKKPIVVHTRSAPDDTLRILDEEGAREVGGIIHCFSEDRPFAKRALDLDFDLSFSGIVTFKNATAIQDVARWAPSDRILIETDSPYLSPVPRRGKRNEPANLVHTARFVADLRGVSFEEITQQSSQNAVRRLTLVLT